jgi:heme oxygenase
MQRGQRDADTSAAGAMQALRSATWPAHERLERCVDVKTRFSTLASYRDHLAKMWGFCAGLEQPIDADTFAAALPDYESRRKLPSLTRDLHALGIDADHLPVCRTLPACTDLAVAFGRLYVLEGATLGARVLLPIVKRELGLDAEHGAAYLESYGSATGERWAVFGAALDAWCATPERRSAAIAAAIDTFAALQSWLTEAPA